MEWKKLNYTEPAVLRGIVTSGLALVGAVGVVVPADLPPQIDALVISAAAVIPIAQALWTRFNVWSPRKVDETVRAAEVNVELRHLGYRTRPSGPQTPGEGDHAL